MGVGITALTAAGCTGEDTTPAQLPFVNQVTAHVMSPKIVLSMMKPYHRTMGGCSDMEQKVRQGGLPARMALEATP